MTMTAADMWWLPRGALRGSVNLTQETFDQKQFNADLLPIFVQHARIENVADLQDRVIAVYLSAAVAIVENYTLRDVWLRQRAWACEASVPVFDFRRGAWKDIVCPTDHKVEGDVGPKTWGFRLTQQAGVDYTIGVTSGYATLDEVPIDMVSFILAAAGWQYDMREIATYQTAIQHADVFPLYLLDSWSIPSYA